MSEPYGCELIIDLHECRSLPCTRLDLKMYLEELCGIIDMQREDLHFWDYEGDDEAYEKAPVHLKGISAVQFIKTSNITIHTLDELRRVYLNIFSCKVFNSFAVAVHAKGYFKGEIIKNQVIMRE